MPQAPETLLASLLGPEPPPPVSTLDEALASSLATQERWGRPVLAAIAGGAAADRLGYALVAGYHAALVQLVGARGPGALCATEEGGAHPRAIACSLDGGKLRGVKRWATLGPRARQLYVLASAGADPAVDGRKRLRLVRVDAAAPGVTVTEVPPTPFAPEVPHAEVRFDDVAVSDGDVLPGDGWDDYVKPFRTIEDIAVHAALIGHLLGAARRYGWPDPLRERLACAALSCTAVGDLTPRAAATHVALAGLIAASAALVRDCDPSWGLAPDDVRARWQRDRPLLDVATRAREARRAAAWQTLRP